MKALRFLVYWLGITVLFTISFPLFVAMIPFWLLENLDEKGRFISKVRD